MLNTLKCFSWVVGLKADIGNTIGRAVSGNHPGVRLKEGRGYRVGEGGGGGTLLVNCSPFVIPVIVTWNVFLTLD